MYNKNRQNPHLKKGHKPWNNKLTKEKILEIRKLLKTGKYIQQELANIYKVSGSSISHIELNNTWID